MEKIKILHVLEAGRYSGPNSTISRLVNRLQERFEFMVLFSADDSERFRSEFSADKVLVSQKNLTRIRSGFWNILNYLVRFPIELVLIYSAVKRFRPDLIHAHTYLDVKGVIIGRLLGVPTIWQLHLDKPDARFLLFYRLTARLFGTNFISVSEVTQKGFFVEKYSNGLNCVIQSSVDRDMFRPSLRTDVDGHYTVVSVGNYHPRKGFEMVLDLAVAIAETNWNTNVKFKILGRVFHGSEGYYNELEEKIRKLDLDNVELITHGDVAEILNAGDIFMLTSYAEASPFVVWEAASCGLPILSTDVGDVKSFLNQYGAGVTIKREDVSYSLSQLAYVINNYSDLRNGALKMSESEFDLDTIAEKYSNAYLKTLQK